ncbi:MAG: C1 family peptidase, partial [Myxococcota bacterium]
GVVAALRWPDNSWGTGSDGIGNDPAEGDEGGHAVHLVGWQRNGNYAGGGLVIFKNSWGSGWGDNGYGYLPLARFGDALKSLTVIDVVAERNDPPSIDIREDGREFPLGNAVTLHADIDDEDGNDCCTVTWSEAGTVLGTGDTLNLDPSTSGIRRITASARDRYGAFDQATASIGFYTNQSPRVQIERPVVPPGQDWVAVPRNTWISFSGTVSDPNQFIPCDERRWSISGVSSLEGCTRTTYLTENGLYTVTFSAEDDAGEVSTDQIRLLVKDWTEYDPPYFTIWEPRANDFLLWSDRVWFSYDSKPSGVNATVTWELETERGITRWDNNQSFSFILYEEVNVPLDVTNATLRAEFTIDGVTRTDSIPVRLGGIPQ